MITGWTHVADGTTCDRALWLRLNSGAYACQRPVPGTRRTVRVTPIQPTIVEEEETFEFAISDLVALLEEAVEYGERNAVDASTIAWRMIDHLRATR